MSMESTVNMVERVLIGEVVQVLYDLSRPLIGSESKEKDGQEESRPV